MEIFWLNDFGSEQADQRQKSNAPGIYSEQHRAGERPETPPQAQRLPDSPQRPDQPPPWPAPRQMQKAPRRRCGLSHRTAGPPNAATMAG